MSAARLALVALLVAACDPVEYDAARDALAAADEVEVLALGQEVNDPSIEIAGESIGTAPRHPVLGRAIVRGPERDAILDALDDAVDGAVGTTFRCFRPHHALRASAGDVTVLVPICFECRAIRVPGRVPQLEIGESPELERLLGAALGAQAHVRFVPGDRARPWVATD